MAAVDFYINETTRHADVILPPTGRLERDHYDLVFHLLAVRDTARFSPGGVPQGAAAQRHDWEIFREIDARVSAGGSGGSRARAAAEAARPRSGSAPRSSSRPC